MTIPVALSQFTKSIFLLSSEEPLLVRDWLDQARSALQQQGFEEILTHSIVTGFDWDGLLEDSQSMSLFSSRKCHILRFSGNRPGQAGAKFISQICEAPLEDVVFILVMDRLDRAATNSAWHKKIAQQGEVCALKPVYPNELGRWISERAASKGLNLDYQAALYLADLTEGNLLASDQELEKLALSFSDGQAIDLNMIRESIARSSRYTQYLLTDACLAGKAQRAVKILHGLELEGVQPVQIQYALQQMLQTLLQLKLAQQLNRLNDGLWRSLNIWKSKQGLYQQALRRFDNAQIERLLQSCATLDRVNKGQQWRYPQSDWQVLRQLVEGLLGVGPDLTPVTR
jgi:DNA polymerase-3 subunit delta